MLDLFRAERFALSTKLSPAEAANRLSDALGRRTDDSVSFRGQVRRDRFVVRCRTGRTHLNVLQPEARGRFEASHVGTLIVSEIGPARGNILWVVFWLIFYLVVMMGPVAREVLAGRWPDELWMIILVTVFVLAILFGALMLSRRFFREDPEALRSFLAEALEATPAQDPRPVE